MKKLLILKIFLPMAFMLSGAMAQGETMAWKGSGGSCSWFPTTKDALGCDISNPGTMTCKLYKVGYGLHNSSCQYGDYPGTATATAVFVPSVYSLHVWFPNTAWIGSPDQVCARATNGSSMCWRINFVISPASIALTPDTDGDGSYDDTDTDDDNDGVVDISDNCVRIANNDQLDTDGDEQGDACDTDDDNDGVLDTYDLYPTDNTQAGDYDGDGIEGLVDNCVSTSNLDQLNTDGDAQGNVCDTDDDNDGVVDTSDKFPLNAAASSDSDNDGFPGSWRPSCDATCQANSGLTLDNCPTTANPTQANFDGDTQGDACDADDDNDGVPDSTDAFDVDPTESVDTDNDGIGNNADRDDDNDGVPDTIDAAPLDAGNSSEIVLPLDGSYKGMRLENNITH